MRGDMSPRYLKEQPGVGRRQVVLMGPVSHRLVSQSVPKGKGPGNLGKENGLKRSNLGGAVGWDMYLSLSTSNLVTVGER